MRKFRPFILSLSFHSAFILALFYLPTLSFPNRTQQEIEIVYEKPKLTPDGTLYEDYTDQEEETKDIELLKNKVKRLSRIVRRVEKEVQARELGRSQNLNPSLPSIQKRLKQELQDPNAPSIDKSVTTQGVGRNLRQVDSSISRLIPEVEIGAFSSLNSDQFVFYTFYARTNEQIRNRWVENIRAVLAKSSPQDFNRLAGRDQNTRLEVILNPLGELVKVLIHQKSQSQELDESAASAFRIAAPLNNPPEEMIAEDGYIHLHYMFTLYFRPRYIASGSK